MKSRTNRCSWPFRSEPVGAYRLLLALLLLCAALARAAEPDLLEPEQAFRFSARLKDARSIEVTYEIAPGYYLYREQFKFAVTPAGCEARRAAVPARQDQERRVFRRGGNLSRQSLDRAPARVGGAETAAVTLSAVSQGCADVGVCYIPQEQKAQLQLAAAGGRAPSARRRSAFPARSAPGPAPTTRVSPAFRRRLLADSSPASSGSACCSPLRRACSRWCPILSGIIVGARPARDAGCAGSCFAAIYVLGMAITYAVGGRGGRIVRRDALRGAAERVGARRVRGALRRASRWRCSASTSCSCRPRCKARLAAASNRLHGGRIAGVFVMGVLSALIVGPCVAAPLAGALLYISQSRDVVLGGSALFAMALGMGAPLLLGRRLGRRVAAQGRPVDGDGEALLRRGAARRRDLYRLAAAPARRAHAAPGRPC